MSDKSKKKTKALIMINDLYKDNSINKIQYENLLNMVIK